VLLGKENTHNYKTQMCASKTMP